MGQVSLGGAGSLQMGYIPSSSNPSSSLRALYMLLRSPEGGVGGMGKDGVGVGFK